MIMILGMKSANPPNPNFENRIKAYRDEVTDFHNNEMPKVQSNYICLAVKGD